MNDLQLDLTGAADTFDLPPGDVHTVVARARARGRRRQRIVVGAAAVALVGSSVAGLRLLAAGDPTTTLAAGGSAMRLEEGAVNWEAVEPGSVLSLLQQRPATVSPSGRLYALSTAPGEADLGQPLPRVVWQSDDGVDWAAAPLSDDIFLSDLAASDERIYAVGTGPAAAAVAGGRPVPEVVVGWSDDGAENWQTAALDIDLPAIAEASRSVSVGQAAAVATTPAGTVASVTILADLNVPRFLPEGATAPHGWAITAAGVDLLGPAPDTCPDGTPVGEDTAPATPGRVWNVACGDSDHELRFLPPQQVRAVTASFTWEDLGVSGDLRRAVLGQPLVFSAPVDTIDFERVEVPVDGLRSAQANLHADQGGFLLVVPGDPVAGESTLETTVLESRDGRIWTEADDLPGGLSWIQAAGRVGETFVLLGQGLAGEGTLVTDTGAGWQATTLAELLGAEPGMSFLSADVSPEGIVAVHTRANGDEQFDPRLLVSGDATTWSAQSVSDLIEDPVTTVGQPVITGDQAVVPVAPIGPRGPDGHLQQVALVATLP